MDMTQVIRARQELLKLGLVEDSGKRRPDRTGVLQVVWQLSPLGVTVAEYQRQGLTLEQALSRATRVVAGEAKH
jgi:hypothetical protein